MESERRTDAFRTLEARSLETTPNRDALTGLHSRAWFDGKLAERLSEKRGLRTPLTVLLADIDGLQDINVAHGQSTGDQLIAGVASLLRRRVRQRDLVARHSGGSFAVLLPAATAPAGRGVAERLRTILAEERHELLPAAAPLQVTVSVGCVTVERGGLVTHQQILDAATRALTAAKRAGRDRVVSVVGTTDLAVDAATADVGD